LLPRRRNPRRFEPLFLLGLMLCLAAKAQSTSADSFNPPAPDYVFSLVVQPDGMVLVGDGYTVGGQNRNYIYRLHPGGIVDTSFNPGVDGWVSCLAVHPDKKILVSGQFMTLGGQARNYIGQLNEDGTLDTSFSPGSFSPGTGGFSWIALQPDGKILVG